MDRAPPEKRATALDVAKHLGVSRSTVSRALTPNTRVAHKTRERIEKAAAELGYLPNPVAQSLISGKSHLVAIMMAHLSNPIHGVFAEAIMRRLQDEGLVPITLINDGETLTTEQSWLLSAYHVSMVVLTSMTPSAQLVRSIRATGVPLLLFNRVVSGEPVPSVSTDLQQGGHLAADHLVEMGARRIAITTGPGWATTALDRETGFRHGLAAHGLEPVCVVPADFTYEGGVQAADALAAKAARPDGILCCNDLSAMGLMDRLRHTHGWRVPQDLMVVGFDDSPMSAWDGYQLTSVRLPIRRMLDVGVTIIRRAVFDAADEPPQNVLIPCRLMRRASTKCLP